MHTNDQRAQDTTTVYQWIEEYGGPDLAQFWFWERTPMPVGLPLDEQLEEGIALAVRACS